MENFADLQNRILGAGMDSRANHYKDYSEDVTAQEITMEASSSWYSQKAWTLGVGGVSAFALLAGAAAGGDTIPAAISKVIGQVAAPAIQNVVTTMQDGGISKNQMLSSMQQSRSADDLRAYDKISDMVYSILQHLRDLNAINAQVMDAALRRPSST